MKLRYRGEVHDVEILGFEVKKQTLNLVLRKQGGTRVWRIPLGRPEPDMAEPPEQS